MPELNVYVPRSGSWLAEHILPRSGIVGTPKLEGRVLIDYEGRRYGQENMRSYADRVHHAAGRHLTSYPTVARSFVRQDDVLLVGRWDTTSRILDVTDAVELARWLEVPLGELDGPSEGEVAAAVVAFMHAETAS